MPLLWFILRSSRVLVLCAIIAGAVGGASGTGLIALVHTALSTASPSLILIYSFTGLCILMFISRITSRLLLINIAQKAVFDLRVRMGRQILAAPLRQLEELGAHRIVAAMTDDVIAITTALTYIPQLCIHLATFLACLVYLATLSWTVFLGVLGFTMLGALSYRLIVSRALRSLRRAREIWDTLCHHFRALTEGVAELKLHAGRREAFLADVYEPTAAALRQANVVGRTLYSVATIWGQVLFFICLGLLLFALPMQETSRAQALTGYVLVLLYMRAPLESLVVILPILGRANVALRKVQELGLSLQAHPREDLSPSLKGYEPGWERLELIGASSTYAQPEEQRPFTLGPLNMIFHPGELVFLVGGNGSGKTTLAKLITGLYVPETGEIRLDGQAIHDENREAYRQHFSAVFSDFYLFERLLGMDVSDLDAQARDYLVQFQLDQKVRITDGEWSTIELSRGQRKRLALLTAYLEDRPFYVFDEWAADQEPLFKEIFYYQLLPALKARGKTVLVISHDDRYYHVADRIIKLDYGQIDNAAHVMHDQSRMARNAVD